ncbi:MAG: beta-lactamase family protein [Hamadaea sp.]|uniref:serine hydrolase domain-containing protein n=1 Tax=Hamadaea sp. TaxID=2024425 RepID=UPI00180B4812|nr:serine hydrolase domain-containing protein [Hamadaea sp.]NUT18586.1 beta-lactamase family protein [Hamadaea sp.]
MHNLLSMVLTAAIAVQPATHPVKDLEQALQSVRDAGAPAAMVLVRDDHVVRTATAGVADTVTGRPANAVDHFRAGSVTKTFVATVVLQLVAERRLALDDRLGTLLPGVLSYADTITVRQLLNHTSGVPEFLGIVIQKYAEEPQSWYREWSPAELVGLIADQPPQFPAGTDGHYSNTGYILLGMIVEKVTGRSLATEIRHRISQPLGLRGTSLAERTTLPAPAMHGYAPMPGADPVDVTEWNPSAAWAAGALVSTLSDLARFYRALLGGALLPRPLLRQMLTTTDVDGIAYGLGIFQAQTPCGVVWGHNGAVFGYITDVFTSPDGSRQVVLAENYYDEGAWRAQESLIGSLLCSN